MQHKQANNSYNITVLQLLRKRWATAQCRVRIPSSSTLDIAVAVHAFPVTLHVQCQ